MTTGSKLWKALPIAALPAVFLGGTALGVWTGTNAWKEGCRVELNLGAKFLKTDCSSAEPEGTPIEFVSPTPPLPLWAALQRVAQMTESRKSQRVFLDPALANAPFAQSIVRPPVGSQRALVSIRQLLEAAGASDQVDICLVREGGYRIQLKPSVAR